MMRSFYALCLLLCASNVWGGLSLSVEHDPNNDNSPTGGSFTVNASNDVGTLDIMSFGLDLLVDNFTNISAINIDSIMGPVGWTGVGGISSPVTNGETGIPGFADFSGLNPITIPASPSSTPLIKVNFSKIGGMFEGNDSFDVSIRNTIFTEVVPLTGAVGPLNLSGGTIAAVPEVSSFACVCEMLLFLGGAGWLRKRLVKW